ncbi:FAD:protein FMN transferase [Balneolales bacterium ANBcel1]|nr:FAD:protein FMN transferase [Balneolales bacterium ANBcel1]
MKAFLNPNYSIKGVTHFSAPIAVATALLMISGWISPTPAFHSFEEPQDRIQNKERYQFTSPHMGSRFRIVLYASSDSLASAAADSAFRRVDELNEIMSDYQSDSELNQLAATAGSGEYVPVSRPLFEVLHTAQMVAEQTGGAFDITAGPFVRLWREMRRDDHPQLPGEEALREAARSVGYKHVHLDDSRQKVMLEKPGMKLDLGGIAKGYAADEMQKVLYHFGITSVLIDAGGDMVIGAAPPGTDGWRIAVSAHNEDGDPEPFLLTLTDTALSTSGDLFQFVEIDGTRYSHIIDPGTGLGITERRTVTVIAGTGMLADAYSTALSILPISEGLDLINKKTGYAAYIEVAETDGTVLSIASETFRELREK